MGIFNVPFALIPYIRLHSKSISTIKENVILQNISEFIYEKKKYI